MLQKNQKIANTIYYLIALIMIFLIALHYHGYVEKDIIKVSIIMLLISIIVNRRLELDIEFFVLLGTMILYGIVFEYYYSNTEYWINWNFADTVWPPVLLYLLLKQFSWRQKEVRIRLLLLTVCLGTFIYSVLNHLMYVQEGFLPDGRIWNEYWTHSERFATEFSYWGVFIVGLLGYGLYCLSKRKWIQGSIICVLIGVENGIQIMVDNRMVLMVTVVVAIVSAFLYIYFNKNNMKKLKIFLISAVIMIVALLLILVFNIGGIRDTQFFIHFTTRDGGILKNIRFQMIWEAVCMLPSHWKGGGTMYPAGLNCVHNYWLQVANDTGIITFALWMIFNISMIVSLIKCVRSPKISNQTKYLIVPLMSAVVSYLSMEIGGQGESEYIIFYVMIAAILHQLVKNQKYEL